MNAFTHMGIAKRVKLAVEKELNVKLDASGFILGNIKPDISSYLASIPHFKEEATEFIRTEIYNLMNVRWEECTKQFSEKLGIIMHYLSDFFCYAHSNKFTGGILEHHLYEMQLSGYCRFNAKTISGFRYDKIAEGNESIYTLWSDIDRWHEEYSSKSTIPSYELDMYFTLKVCTSVCVSIISNCITQKNCVGNAA